MEIAVGLPASGGYQRYHTNQEILPVCQIHLVLEHFMARAILIAGLTV